MSSALWVRIALVDAPGFLVDALTFPASIGEFWMIGYLLVRGIRPMSAAPRPASRTTVAATA